MVCMVWLRMLFFQKNISLGKICFLETWAIFYCHSKVSHMWRGASILPRMPVCLKLQLGQFHNFMCGNLRSWNRHHDVQRVFLRVFLCSWRWHSKCQPGKPISPREKAIHDMLHLGPFSIRQILWLFFSSLCGNSRVLATHIFPISLPLSLRTNRFCWIFKHQNKSRTINS